MGYGAIYIAHNPRDGENTFKVGKTERIVDERMKELSSSTSNLGTYSAKAYFIVTDIDEAERKCHQRLTQYRVQKNREFFNISFDRIIKIIRKTLEPFSANNYYSKYEDDELDNYKSKYDSKEKLTMASKKHKSSLALWKNTLKDANNTAENWFNIIVEKAKEAEESLSDEKSIHWSISSKFEINNFPREYPRCCSVTLHAQFNATPLNLNFSEARVEGDTELDLSRVISETVIISNESGVDHIKWQEVDDGRFGIIFISVDSPSETCTNPRHLPRPNIYVNGGAIKYFSESQNYVAQLGINRTSFEDPDEAFEKFLSLLIENITIPQYDIRVIANSTKKDHTEIFDKGKFIQKRQREK